jgi:small conductance mechanosensitive channel
MSAMPTLNAASIQNFLFQVGLRAAEYLPHILLALLTLWIGFAVTNFLVKALTRVLHHRHVDITVSVFLQSLVSIAFKVLVIISVAAMIGVQVTSFIAVLGAATLAVGMSLQGSLGNFAGGILILLLKPFNMDEEIEAQGQRGVVERIDVFSTVIRRGDGTIAILPNGALSNSVIVNHSRKAK